MKGKESFLKIYNEGITPSQMNAVRGGYAGSGDETDGICLKYECKFECGCVFENTTPCSPICQPIVGK